METVYLLKYYNDQDYEVLGIFKSIEAAKNAPSPLDKPRFILDDRDTPEWYLRPESKRGNTVIPAQWYREREYNEEYLTIVPRKVQG